MSVAAALPAALVVPGLDGSGPAHCRSIRERIDPTSGAWPEGRAPLAELRRTASAWRAPAAGESARRRAAGELR